MADAEQHLWKRLRMRQLCGLKFRRQHPCAGFIVDFACLEINLTIEIDGGQHNSQLIQDARRTDILQQEGWIVLRFWNDEVLHHIDEVMEAIHASCEKLSPPS